MSLFWSRHDTWEPQGGQRKPWRDLQPGDLLALERRIWRVREVHPIPVIDWDEHDREYYDSHCRLHDGISIRLKANKAASEEEWELRPLGLAAIPASGGEIRHFGVRPYASGGHGAYVLSPHYPVCADCGEPWPCGELDIVAEIEKQAMHVERLEKILPGCCWCCNEPVTHRQKVVRFEGDNILLPGREPTVFHMRAKCIDGARRYERLWVPAGERRTWRLQCPGLLTQHVDGDECSELGLCPGNVYHRRVHGHIYCRYEYGPSGQRTTFRGYTGYGPRCLRCTDAVARGEDEVPYERPSPPGALL